METDYHPPDVALKVLHDDAEMLAVDKPAGLLSVPGKGPELADCLMARVLAVWPQALLVHPARQRHATRHATGGTAHQ